MSPAVWGALTALGWGTGDFIARFTARGVGHVSALFGTLLVGAVVMGLFVLAEGVTFKGGLSGAWLLGVSGVGIMAASLLLYQGLAIGPVAVVSPIVASYPAFVALIAVVMGARLAGAQWLAMTVVMGGVFMVARYAGHIEEPEEEREGTFGAAVLIAVGSSLGFAIAITAGQAATALYGDFQTAILTRLVALAAMVPFFFVPGQRPAIPMRWWPLIAVQGVMDGGAYLALFIGSAGGVDADGVITAVVASGFTGFTVLLARLIIRETITALQWLGIVLIVIGASALTYFGG